MPEPFGPPRNESGAGETSHAAMLFVVAQRDAGQQSAVHCPVHDPLADGSGGPDSGPLCRRGRLAGALGDSTRESLDRAPLLFDVRMGPAGRISGMPLSCRMFAVVSVVPETT